MTIKIETINYKDRFDCNYMVVKRLSNDNTN